MFKRFVRNLQRQLRTHIGLQLSGSEGSSFLCTGEIRPLHQIFGTLPTFKIRFKSFIDQSHNMLKDALIISFEILSIPGAFPFFSF